MNRNPETHHDDNVASGSATEVLHFDKSVDSFVAPTIKALRDRLKEIVRDEVEPLDKLVLQRDRFVQMLSTDGFEGPEADMIRDFLPEIDKYIARENFKGLMPNPDRQPQFEEPEHYTNPESDLKRLRLIYQDTGRRLDYLSDLKVRGQRSWRQVLETNHKECRRLQISEGGTGWYSTPKSLRETIRRRQKAKGQ